MVIERKYHVGCQSWGYEDWITPAGGETVFYPRGTPRHEMLGIYSRIFGTIEIDSTLYGIPAAKTIQKWRYETPEDFIFSLKFPREITHELELRGRSVDIMKEFVDSAAILQEKLGLLLIQFPQSFEATKGNALAFRDFLSALPPGYRFAVEFRNSSWFVDWTFEELKNSGAALCLVQGPWVDRQIMFDAAESVETAFRYVRIMGKRDLAKFDCVVRSQDAVVDAWTQHIQSNGAAETFIYVDNYFEGFAPATANKMLRNLGLPSADPAKLEAQGSLF